VRVDIGGVVGGIEADCDVALRCEVVDLVGADALDQPGQRRGVGHVAVMQRERAVALRAGIEQMLDAGGVAARGAAHEAMYAVVLRQQQLGEIGAVLSGDAGNERDLLSHVS
jgi:hypothetical protein